MFQCTWKPFFRAKLHKMRWNSWFLLHVVSLLKIRSNSENWNTSQIKIWNCIFCNVISCTHDNMVLFYFHFWIIFALSVLLRVHITWTSMRQTCAHDSRKLDAVFPSSWVSIVFVICNNVYLTRAPRIRSIFPSKRTRPSHARRHFYPVTFERRCRRRPPSISPCSAKMPRFSVRDASMITSTFIIVWLYH